MSGKLIEWVNEWINYLVVGESVTESVMSLRTWVLAWPLYAAIICATLTRLAVFTQESDGTDTLEWVEVVLARCLIQARVASAFIGVYNETMVESCTTENTIDEVDFICLYTFIIISSISGDSL